VPPDVATEECVKSQSAGKWFLVCGTQLPPKYWYIK